MRVRQRHQHRPADPRLEVLRGEPLQPAERVVERPDDALDRDLAEVDAEVLAHLARIVARPLRGEARGHRNRVHAFAPSASAAIAAVSAESIPPEIPSTTSPKPFFDVVAEPEPEREAHLVELRLERRHGRRNGLLHRAGRREPDRGRRRGSRQGPLELLRRTSRRRRPIASVGSTSTNEQRLLEPRRAGDHLALVVEHHRVPVEDELVLSADEVAEGDVDRVVARARDEHLLAVLGLPHVEGRRAEVDEQRRARQGEVGRRWAGLPDVLADGRADEHVAELEHEELAPRCEVAMLVEDAVVGQEVPCDRRLRPRRPSSRRPRSRGPGRTPGRPRARRSPCRPARPR